MVKVSSLWNYLAKMEELRAYPTWCNPQIEAVFTNLSTAIIVLEEFQYLKKNTKRWKNFDMTSSHAAITL
jgi:hypothetical protein